MKNGRYLVSFEVDLSNHKDEDEAQDSINTLLEEAMLENQFPKVNFELLEELDEEYTTEDDGLEELDFEEAV